MSAMQLARNVSPGRHKVFAGIVAGGFLEKKRQSSAIL
jgi:hypothetical protein